MPCLTGCPFLAMKWVNMHSTRWPSPFLVTYLMRSKDGIIRFTKSDDLIGFIFSKSSLNRFMVKLKVVREFTPPMSKARASPSSFSSNRNSAGSGVACNAAQRILFAHVPGRFVRIIYRPTFTLCMLLLYCRNKNSPIQRVD